MLFTRPFKLKIRAGEVTLSFRAWKRPQVKVGGVYNIPPYGAIQVDGLEPARLSQITAPEAARAGFDSVDDLRSEVTRRHGPGTRLYRIEFRYLGESPVARPKGPDSALTRDEYDALAERLDRMDARTRDGAWTRAFLGLIAERPATRAPDLATSLGWETARFKANVRKLKRLGLTESLKVGYRLSVRGKSFLSFEGRDSTCKRPSST